jgi:hypothetical protein
MQGNLKISTSSNFKSINYALLYTRKQEKKVKVTFSNGLLLIEKEGGKQQVFPLEWFPKLQCYRRRT